MKHSKRFIPLLALLSLIHSVASAGDIHKAAKKGNLGLVSEQLSAGVFVDIKDRNGQTPLFHAVNRRKPDVAILLIDAGADVTKKMDDGYGNEMTPFHMAVYKGLTEVVRKMLDAGADPMMDNFYYGPPLHISLEFNHTEITNLLLKNGASPAEVSPFKGSLSEADLELGRKIARGCEFCHNTSKALSTTPFSGPTLWEIVDRQKASADGYSDYSSAIKDHAGTWSYDELNSYIMNPRMFIPGTRMLYSGVTNEEQRTALIAFLRTLSDNPKPIP